MSFQKYQSVKQPHKFLMRDRENFMDGHLYAFPKMDGANASVWLREDGTLGFGSRNQDLSDTERGQLIPRLLQQVYNSFIEDNMWAILKKYRNPTINFKSLQSIINQNVREIKKELF